MTRWKVFHRAVGSIQSCHTLIGLQKQKGACDTHVKHVKGDRIAEDPSSLSIEGIEPIL